MHYLKTEHLVKERKTVAMKIEDKWIKYALKEAVGTPITKEKLAKIVNLEWNEYRAEAEMEWGSVRDITPLRHCVNLKVLSFDGNAVADLTPLSNLGKLEEIWLVQNMVEDLTPLSNSHSLKKIVLDLNSRLTSIKPLSGLQNLIYLNIGSTKVSDITPLLTMPALKEVKLYGIKNLDLSPESEATKVIEQLRAANVEVRV